MSTKLIFHEMLHGVVALPFLILTWRKTRSITRVFVVLLITYLVDLDHLVDYFKHFGTTFDIGDFLRSQQFVDTNRAIVPLHAWEWVGISAIIGRRRGWKSIFTLFALGAFPHLVLDAINVGSVLFYSIAFRLANGFATPA